MVTIVTGASCGISRAVAERLCHEGANITLCTRGKESLAGVQHSLEAFGGGKVLAIEADLTDQAVANCVAEATARSLWPSPLIIIVSAVTTGGAN